MPDLADYIWMRQQWQRFRRLLTGALAAVIVVGGSGLVYLGQPREDGEPRWFFARAGLMLLLSTASLVGLWLWWRATREIRNLSRLAAEARMEQARRARQGSPQAKKKDRGGD